MGHMPPTVLYSVGGMKIILMMLALLASHSLAQTANAPAGDVTVMPQMTMVKVTDQSLVVHGQNVTDLQPYVSSETMDWVFRVTRHLRIRKVTLVLSSWGAALYFTYDDNGQLLDGVVRQ